MWTQHGWLTFIHSLVVARPEEDKVRDKIFPDQVHKVVRKRLGKPQGPESTEKRNPFDTILLVKRLPLFVCGRGLHYVVMFHKAIVPFHVHEHGSSRHVAKPSADVAVEGAKASRAGVICSPADCTLNQFTHA